MPQVKRGRLVQVNNAIAPRSVGEVIPGTPQPKGKGPFPDRAAVDKTSPHYVDWRGASVGIRINGAVRFQNDVLEYCISEGWIKVPVRKDGKIHKERGKPLLLTLHGVVEPFWK